MRTKLIMAAAASMLLGCRGTTSEKPPIHLNPNMDFQWRFDRQEPSEFFKDKRGMRPLGAETVVHGSLSPDEAAHLHLHEGLVDGKFTDALPAGMTVDAALLNRGHDRYQIYCVPCHNDSGRGDGIVVRRGGPAPQSYMEPRLRAYPLGRIVNVLRHGKNNMASYADQIPVADRWAIATYVRALQIAGAPSDDLAKGGN